MNAKKNDQLMNASAPLNLIATLKHPDAQENDLKNSEGGDDYTTDMYENT